MLLAVFFVVLMAALALSVQVYRSVANIQSGTNDQRTGSGLLANTIRANDATDAIAVGSGPEGASLVLLEDGAAGTYETRIYLYEGAVVQEYALQGSAYDPALATKLIETNTFSFLYKNKLLTITTDTGSTSIALRSDYKGSR